MPVMPFSRKATHVPASGGRLQHMPPALLTGEWGYIGAGLRARPNLLASLLPARAFHHSHYCRLRAAHSLMRSVMPLCVHASWLTSMELRMSSWKASSMLAPNSVPSTTTFTTLLCKKLRTSKLAEPTTDHAPATTAVFACSTEAFNS